MNRHQCRGCSYFRRLSCGGGGGEKGYNACHHMLDTGKARKRNGDICLSRYEGKIEVNNRPEQTEPTGMSVYTGYKIYYRYSRS